LQRCTFQGVTVSGAATAMSASQVSGLHLHECTFATDNVLQVTPSDSQPIGSYIIGVDASSDVFSDVDVSVRDTATGAVRKSQPMASANTFSTPFLDMAGTDFRGVVQVRGPVFSGQCARLWPNPAGGNGVVALALPACWRHEHKEFEAVCIHCTHCRYLHVIQRVVGYYSCRAEPGCSLVHAAACKRQAVGAIWWRQQSRARICPDQCSLWRLHRPPATSAHCCAGAEAATTAAERQQ
jgi:hypothetical protein